MGGWVLKSRICSPGDGRTGRRPRSQEKGVYSRMEVEQMLGVHRCRREATLRRWTYDRDGSAMTENMQGGS